MDEINNQEQVQDVEEIEIKDTQQNEEIVEEKKLFTRRSRFTI